MPVNVKVVIRKLHQTNVCEEEFLKNIIYAKTLGS